MKNKSIRYIILFCAAAISALPAFEGPLYWQPGLTGRFAEPLTGYALTGNPAAFIYEGNIQAIRIGGDLRNMAYRRSYDPAASRDLNAEYATVRRIDDRSFFSTSITYNDYRQHDLFASMEKYFYDDYFSMTDSTTGDITYYGPQLHIMYNAEIMNNVFLGLQGDYGVERSLKDTFPETITIMRNSGYKAGIDWRKGGTSLGVFGRYYDNQVHYEAVKEYSNVKANTYLGYNVFYNELSASRLEKARNRKGIEYGGHFGFGKNAGFSGNIALTGLQRQSLSELIRGSHTHSRGLWMRKGRHLAGDLMISSRGAAAFRIYGEHLRYTDWGESLISGTLVLENDEISNRIGGMFIYRPSLAQQAYIGAETGKVHYDYIEYVFPFEDERSGREWNLYAGSRLYAGPKTQFRFDLSYGKEIPRFYWDTESFQNTDLRISLEQLFSFGYIQFMFEYCNKKPEAAEESIDGYTLFLTYIRK